MKKQALVIVDLQEAILNVLPTARFEETNKAFAIMVSKVSELLARVRAKHGDVIYIQHEGSKGHRLEKDTKGWQIKSEIAPKAGEPVMHKKNCDSFYQTNLEQELRRRGIERLLIVGCATQYCVDTICRRAVSLGFDVTLVSDCHMTADAGVLKFEDIIAHHNDLLSDFNAGEFKVSVRPFSDIEV